MKYTHVLIIPRTSSQHQAKKKRGSIEAIFDHWPWNEMGITKTRPRETE